MKGIKKPALIGNQHAKKEKTRSCCFKFMLYPEELEQLNKLAKALGLNKSEFIRKQTTLSKN